MYLRKFVNVNLVSVYSCKTILKLFLNLYCSDEKYLEIKLSNLDQTAQKLNVFRQCIGGFFFFHQRVHSSLVLSTFSTIPIKMFQLKAQKQKDFVNIVLFIFTKLAFLYNDVIFDVYFLLFLVISHTFNQIKTS